MPMHFKHSTLPHLAHSSTANLTQEMNPEIYEVPTRKPTRMLCWTNKKDRFYVLPNGYNTYQ